MSAADGLPLGMTDLEEAMRSPGGAAVRDAAVARLDAAIGRVCAELDSGLGAEGYDRAEKIRDGLTMALAVVSAFPVSDN